MLLRSAALLLCALSFFAGPLVAQTPSGAPTDDLHLQIPQLGDAGEKKLEAGDTRGAIDDFKKAFEASRTLSQRYPQEPAYRENAYYYLGRLATAFGSLNEIASALQMAEPSARGYAEIAAADPSSENKEKAAEALGRLAWFQVLSKDGARAEATAQQALALSPQATFVKLNLAHAFLLQGQAEKARAIYAEVATERAGEGRGIREIILDDFDAMQKAGVPAQTLAAGRAALGGDTRKAPASRLFLIFTFAVVALIFLGIGAVVAALIYVDRKRTAALEAKATSLGFTFRRKPTAEDKELTAGSALTSVGRAREIRNVIELPAAEGARMTLFDFSYVIGSGKSNRTYRQTVTRIQSPRLSLPTFDLRPESMLMKIAQTFGMKDIDVEGFPDFSRMYLVRGADDAAIRRMLVPDLVRYCEAHPRLWISGASDVLWFHREDRRVKPDDLATFVEGAQQMFTLFTATQANAGTPPPLPTA